MNFLERAEQMGWDMQDARSLAYSDLPTGALLGEVTIVDCITESNSPWFYGPYGYMLDGAVPYEDPIPYRGRLGFFEV